MIPLICLKDIAPSPTREAPRFVQRLLIFPLDPGPCAWGLIGGKRFRKNHLAPLSSWAWKSLLWDKIALSFGKERAKTEKRFPEGYDGDIGFLFQNADDQLFCPTVLEDVAFGPLNMGQPPALARENARRTLADLNLVRL